MEIPQKFWNRTIIWSSNPTLEYIQKKMKSGSQRDISTPMFIAASFTIAKIWKQPKCLWTNTWLAMWDFISIAIAIREYYLVFKKKEILPFGTTWINSGRHYANWNKPAQKEKYCMVSLIYFSNTVKAIEAERRMVIGRGRGDGENESC